jgi:predicted small integral membrane protein
MVVRKILLGQHRKQQRQQRLSQHCRQQRSPVQQILQVPLQALALLQALLARLLQIMVQVQRQLVAQALRKQHQLLQLHQTHQHLLWLLMVLRRLLPEHLRKQQHQQQRSQPCRQQRSPVQQILEVHLPALALLRVPQVRLHRIVVQVQRQLVAQALRKQHQLLQLHQTHQHLLWLLMALRRLLPEHLLKLLRKQQRQQRLSQHCRQQRSPVQQILQVPLQALALLQALLARLLQIMVQVQRQLVAQALRKQHQLLQLHQTHQHLLWLLMVLRRLLPEHLRKQQHQQQRSQPCRQQRSPVQQILEVHLPALALLRAPLARLLQIMVQVHRQVADQALRRQHQLLQLHHTHQHLLWLLMALHRLLPEHLLKLLRKQQRLSQPCRQQRSPVQQILAMQRQTQALELDLLLGQMQIVWVHQALLVLRVPIRSAMLN